MDGPAPAECVKTRSFPSLPRAKALNIRQMVPVKMLAGQEVVCAFEYGRVSSCVCVRLSL